jgi:hypothetical protein
MIWDQRWGSRLVVCLVTGLSAILLVNGAAWAQVAPSKQTVMVVMRDGTHLATDVWLPAGVGPWPVALARTPYDKSAVRQFGTNLSPPFLLNNGIALVVQDMRGRWASEGEAWPFLSDAWGEQQDGADTLAWIRRQSWSNGRVATIGGSSLGVAQLHLAGARPEGLVGQYIVVAPLSPYHYIVYPKGVFRKSLVEQLLVESEWPSDVLPLFRAHPTYDDFWRGLDLGTRAEEVRWPIVHVGGWFDLFPQGTIDTFTQLQERGGEGARGQQRLIIGPWTHNGLFSRRAGDLLFPANAGFPAGAPSEFAWVNFWLKGQPPIPATEPVVRYYLMGDVDDPAAPGNTWRTSDRWPPPSRPLTLYFAANGGLEAQAPAAATTRAYDYDPANPVPSIGGQELYVPPGPRDQRSVEVRGDVLVFSTPPLAAPIQVTGRVRVRIYAASSARDTDFTAKLCDVYPDGRSMLLLDGIVRARHALSLSEPAGIIPGQRYAYDIDLGSTSIVFNRGHHIRVAISSSNAPRFEPNPNTWPISGPTSVSVVARQTITLGGAEASHIVLPEIVAVGQP